MALTAIKGYRKALSDYEFRKQNRLSWNNKTLSYEPAEQWREDVFMQKRIRVMQKIAKNIRP
ncbi:MAG: hypothetical protein MI922_08240, partial [Bacteroidales bacterium]|nr:hypothetical protein [Bacteroidales bacterium]